MRSGLEGKTALVFGAGQGIGRACALRLAEAGASVACLDRAVGRAQLVAKEAEALGARALAVPGDVLSRSSVEEAVAAVVEELGSLDAAVDIVGEGKFKPYLEHTDQDWDDIFDVCLRQFFYVSQTCLRQMVQQGTGGSFVGISSHSAFVGVPALSVYGSAKAALSALVRYAAVELGSHGIRVNAVAPGSTRTPRTTYLDEEPFRGHHAARVPVGRRAEPEEQADAVVFLLSERSSFITGQTLLVDGGKMVQEGLARDENPFAAVAAVPSGELSHFR